MTGKGCKKPGCNLKHKARGFCHRHFYEWRRAPGTDWTRVDPGPVPDGPCAWPGCTKRQRTHRGFCKPHYDAKARAEGRKLPPPPGEQCKILGCEGRVEARGWCGKHYERWRARGMAGLADPAPRSVVRPCSVRDCGRTAERKANGVRWFCGPHFGRWERTGDPGPAEIRRRGSTSEPCKEPGCERTIGSHGARGWCRSHYNQWWEANRKTTAGR